MIMFQMRQYHEPDFTNEMFTKAPDAILVAAKEDGFIPEGFHAMSIFPEYFKVKGKWYLAKESRMDCVAVFHDEEIAVTEFRNVKKGDLVFRTYRGWKRRNIC